MFLLPFSYPVTLFHTVYEGFEQDISEIRSLLDDVQLETVLVPVFQKDHFMFPRRYDEYSNSCLMKKRHGGCGGRHFGYRQMLYFKSYGMFFDTPALHNYHYWLLLDSDSEVIDVQEDPFLHMKKNNLTSLYRGQVFENEACSNHLNEAIDAFLQESMVVPQDREFFREYYSKRMYFYTNVFAGDLNFFTSPDYKMFMDAVLREGGIWKYRWSEQSFYAMSMSIYRSRSNIAPLTLSTDHQGDHR
eukprot:gnl/MRDRNA2_/MRDRNA2_86573_c1_seq1.p1 gnl/MRDRNA2_/MRDRNA2_86573_c1~~gnl/MRDRNA2_/MRDRNA2_86573_c1_seq1.p1  ORF type:complete len:271 (-),score=18.65 gnl/MRDRNA2_/MRDRNA2_86573_c1_seq1:785-1519(-)